jgi:transposase
MARAYSHDLRCKFLEAHRQGEGSLSKLAVRFHVSLGWAKYISATLKRTGKKEKPPAGKRGRKSRIIEGAAEFLRLRVKEQPDRTLAELREDLRHHQGISIGSTQLWTYPVHKAMEFVTNVRAQLYSSLCLGLVAALEQSSPSGPVNYCRG